MIESRLAFRALCGLFLLTGAPFLCAQTYIVKDLGTLGGSLGSSANAINSSGQVVGYAFTTDNVALHATLFSGTGSGNIDLGTLGANPNITSEAYGINDSGQIIGNAANQATLFSGTGSGNVDLDGGTFGEGRAINSDGQMVGEAEGSAVIFSGTGSGNTPLGGLDGLSAGIAYANNSSGQIVGLGSVPGRDAAVLFSGTGSNGLDLGTLGGFTSYAYGINDAGQIVGGAQITGQNSAFHATLFSGTGSNNIDLGTLGGTNSYAYAINNSGLIVGNSQTADLANHGFLYSNGTMQDLNDLVVPGSGVTNIRLQDNARVPGKCLNDAGQIAAVGDVTALGATHAILLTPGTAPPTLLGNISTRLRVETGDNVLIGGFIITGTEPKKVIVRAIGPSLPLADKLADPTLELFGSGGLITSNDNWMDSPNKQEIIDSIPPSNDLESAIVETLPANAGYTAIVRGVNNTTGIGLVEVYDLDSSVDSKLANISTRGLVQTGDNVMIGGFIVTGNEGEKVLVRAIGPSLPLAGNLADPTLELRDSNGALFASNDNWREEQEAEIVATMIPPTNDAESAIVETLAPAAYTAIVRGKNETTGIALIEVYALNP
jgi:probable HAF family extracellular repeat protein